MKYSVDRFSSMSGFLVAHKHMEIGNKEKLNEMHKWSVQQKACAIKITSTII